MNFGFVVSEDNEKAKELFGEAKKYLEDGGHQVLGGDLSGSEVVVTLGGDGTLLHAVCEYVDFGVPFVGINLGTLGFLTVCEASDWQGAIDKIIDGTFFVSERMTLEAEVVIGNTKHEIRKKFRAVNEVVIKGLYRVVKLGISVNNQKLLNASGDGVIVSTQTGSTAYSLSAGGPIVDPELDCILITPVNAHGLPVPSIVLSPKDEVAVEVLGGDDVYLVVDGQEHTKISQGMSVRVERGKYRVKLGYFDKHHFLKSLNAKFGLGSRLGG